MIISSTVLPIAFVIISGSGKGFFGVDSAHAMISSLFVMGLFLPLGGNKLPRPCSFNLFLASKISLNSPISLSFFPESSANLNIFISSFI